MATYPSIFNQAETAFKTAFETIASTDLDAAWTVYRGADYNQLATPAIVIEAASGELSGQAAGSKYGIQFDMQIEVSAITEGEDSTGTVHGNVAGLVQAVTHRSAVQIVTQVNAAGLSNFTAFTWTPGPARNETSGQRRTTIYTGRLNCASTALT